MRCHVNVFSPDISNFCRQWLLVTFAGQTVLEHLCFADYSLLLLICFILFVCLFVFLLFLSTQTQIAFCAQFSFVGNKFARKKLAACRYTAINKFTLCQLFSCAPLLF